MNVGAGRSHWPFHDLFVIHSSILHKRKPLSLFLSGSFAAVKPIAQSELVQRSAPCFSLAEILSLVLYSGLRAESMYGFVRALCECLCSVLIYCFTLQSTAFPAENFFKGKSVSNDIVTVIIVRLSKIHGQHQSNIVYSIKHQVMYLIYIGNYRGRKKYFHSLVCEVLLLCCLCVAVLVCVFVVHRRPIHHILFTVFPCESFACHYSFVL